MSQQPSVPGQTPGGQHLCWEGSPDPAAIGDRTKWPHISTSRTSTRQTETRLTSSPERTGFRQIQTSVQDSQVSPMGEVPAQSPPWRRQRTDGQGDQRGRNQRPSDHEMEHNLDTEPDLSSDSEREQSTEDVSSTPMEDGE